MVGQDRARERFDPDRKDARQPRGCQATEAASMPLQTDP